MDILDEIKSRARGSAATVPDQGDGSEGAYSCPDERPVERPEPDFYTPPEVARMLRVPLRTLEKWVLQRRIPVVKCGRLNRFPRIELQKRILSGSLLK
jgi:excisionase family DNA binding protein